jgi:hypothetical protein
MLNPPQSAVTLPTAAAAVVPYGLSSTAVQSGGWVFWHNLLCQSKNTHALGWGVVCCCVHYCKHAVRLLCGFLVLIAVSTPFACSNQAMVVWLPIFVLQPRIGVIITM